MKKMMFDIALFGQPPHQSDPIRNDWESYLIDFAQHHTATQTRIAILHASAAHIWWRTTTRSAPSAVPAILLAAISATAVAFMSIVDPIASSKLADAHIAIGGVFLTIAFLRQPWKLEHSRMLSISLLIIGSGLMHNSFVVESSAAIYPIAISGLVITSLGITLAGISSLFTKTALGIVVQFWWTFGFGMVLIAIASVLIARDAEASAAQIALVIAALAELAFVSQLGNLWRLNTAFAPETSMSRRKEKIESLPR